MFLVAQRLVHQIGGYRAYYFHPFENEWLSANFHPPTLRLPWRPPWPGYNSRCVKRNTSK